MALDIRPVDPARLRELEGQTLSSETRAKLLYGGNGFNEGRTFIERRRDRWPFRILGVLLVVGCAWLTWEFVR